MEITEQTKKGKFKNKRFWIILFSTIFICNIILFYCLHFAIMAATCMTPQQVQTDMRCLYIVSSQVYEMGTQQAPHMDHPCGTDVTAVVPDTHKQGIAEYLFPNYVANICSAVTPGPQQIATVKVHLHGIGNAGDNANPQSAGTTNPKHLDREAIITIYDNKGQEVFSKIGSVSFANGYFTGTFDLTGLPTGTYVVGIETDGFLNKTIPGFFTITQNQPTTFPDVTLVGGDIDDTNQVDILDYNALISCIGTKQNTDACMAPPVLRTPGADINDDGTVDGADVNLFLREISVQRGI